MSSVMGKAEKCSGMSLASAVYEAYAAAGLASG